MLVVHIKTKLKCSLIAFALKSWRLGRIFHIAWRWFAMALCIRAKPRDVTLEAMLAFAFPPGIMCWIWNFTCSRAAFPSGLVPLPFDLSLKAIVTLAAEAWLSVGILDLTWGRCALPKWSCPVPWNLTCEAIRTPTICANAHAIIDAVTRCRFTVASRMSSPPRNFALEPIFALALQPLPYGVCSCTLCGAAISGPAAVDVPAWFALKAICTTTMRTSEIVGTVEIALCCLCGAAISCPVAVEVPPRFALEAICTTTLGTSEIVGTVELAVCFGANALRIGATPGDFTDIALTASTLGAIPWILFTNRICTRWTE